jgi:hypothetical protein
MLLQLVVVIASNSGGSLALPLKGAPSPLGFVLICKVTSGRLKPTIGSFCSLLLLAFLPDFLLCHRLEREDRIGEEAAKEYRAPTVHTGCAGRSLKSLNSLILVEHPSNCSNVGS